MKTQKILDSASALSCGAIASERQAPIGEILPAACRGMRLRKAEERGEPTRERGFLELNPARVRQGIWLLGVENL